MPIRNHTLKEITVINEYSSLQQFYSFTTTLSQSKRVKFISKNDDADNIDWNFKYRKKPLMLQYNIYNGISLYSSDTNEVLIKEVVGLLK